MILYLQLFCIAFLGWFIQAGLKLRSIQLKAKKANVQTPTSGQYFKDDLVSHALSLASIMLAMFFVSEAGALPYLDKMWALKLVFAFIGYTGADIWSRVFSVTNKRINDAIDYKTTIADTQTGTLDTPTPAAPVSSKKAGEYEK